MTTFLTPSAYARLHRRTRQLIARLVLAAEPGARLPGGGVVVVDPEGRRWIEVDMKPAEARA